MIEPTDPADCLRRAIAAWHGLVPRTPAEERAIADLTATMRALEEVRGGIAFTDEPASFAAVLRELRE